MMTTAGEEEAPPPPQQLRFLHLLWCTLAGLRCTRCVVLAPDEDAASCEGPSPSLSRACISLPVFADVPSPGSGVDGMGGVRLQVDPVTLRSMPWARVAPGGRAQLALVTMIDELLDNGSAWSLCPRGLLQRVLELARDEHGLAFRAGFEIEFVLVDAKGDPLGTQTYCSARCVCGARC
jgi:glutamine synthetase